MMTNIAWAIRSTHHATMKATPAQLTFGRDMTFDIQHQANWDEIQQQKQKEMDQNNEKENECLQKNK